MDLDSIAERSLSRVATAIASTSLECPFCERELSVRRTQIGWIGVEPNRAYIDGVQAKCAGKGCGFRPDFDVPIRKNRGYWPDLVGKAEFDRERELRDGNRGVDMALDAGDEDAVRERLRELGYLE